MLARLRRPWMLASLAVLFLLLIAIVQLGLAGLKLLEARGDLLAGRYANASSEFSEADRQLRASPLLAALRLIPAIRRQVDAVELLSEIGSRGSDAAAQAASAVHTQDLSKLQSARADLIAITADRARLPNSGLAGPIQQTVHQVDARLGEAQQVLPLLPVIEKLLGADGSASYLVLQQDPAELRATGGFIGSVAFLDFSRGKLQPVQPIDIETIDGTHFQRTLGMAGSPKYVPPPWPFFRVLDPGDSWELRDENFSPDFPTSARLAEFLLQRETDRSVQGVIAIDPYLISDLLKLTGPVRVPETGDVLTSANFFETTLRKVELHQGPTPRKSFLSYATSAVIDRLRKMPPRDWLQFASILKQACVSKDIQAYFDDPAAEAMVDGFSCGGHVPAFVSDGLMVVDENLNSNKDDFWISRAFNLRIQPNADGSARHTLTIHYGPYPKLEQLTTPYIDWLRVYVPPGARLLSATGVQAQQASELGDSVLQEWVQFNFGESKDVTLVYDVPASTMHASSQLIWLKQAGRESDPAVLEQTGNRVDQTKLERDHVFSLIQEAG